MWPDMYSITLTLVPTLKNKGSKKKGFSSLQTWQF